MLLSSAYWNALCGFESIGLLRFTLIRDGFVRRFMDDLAELILEPLDI